MGLRKACEWQDPRATAVGLRFQNERATPAVLAFRSGTGGCFGTPRGGGLGGPEEIKQWPEEANLWRRGKARTTLGCRVQYIRH